MSDPDVDEFVALCKLVGQSYPAWEDDTLGKTLDWEHLRIRFDLSGELRSVRGLSDDRQYTTVHYAYRDEPGQFEYDLITIRYALPLLRAATVLERLADV